MKSAFEKVGCWFKQYLRERELDQLGPSETARIAHEFGMNDQEFRSLAARGSDNLRLLQQRLKALGISATVFEHDQRSTLRDLERVCSQCNSPGRCEADLRSRPLAPGWMAYCLNATTLQSLQDSSKK